MAYKKLLVCLLVGVLSSQMVFAEDMLSSGFDEICIEDISFEESFPAEPEELFLEPDICDTKQEEAVSYEDTELKITDYDESGTVPETPETEEPQDYIDLSDEIFLEEETESLDNYNEVYELSREEELYSIRAFKEDKTVFENDSNLEINVLEDIPENTGTARNDLLKYLTNETGKYYKDILIVEPDITNSSGETIDNDIVYLVETDSMYSVFALTDEYKLISKDNIEEAETGANTFKTSDGAKYIVIASNEEETFNTIALSNNLLLMEISGFDFTAATVMQAEQNLSVDTYTVKEMLKDTRTSEDDIQELGISELKEENKEENKKELTIPDFQIIEQDGLKMIPMTLNFDYTNYAGENLEYSLMLSPELTGKNVSVFTVDESGLMEKCNVDMNGGKLLFNTNKNKIVIVADDLNRIPFVRIWDNADYIPQDASFSLYAVSDLDMPLETITLTNDNAVAFDTWKGTFVGEYPEDNEYVVISSYNDTDQDIANAVIHAWDITFKEDLESFEENYGFKVVNRVLKSNGEALTGYQPVNMDESSIEFVKDEEGQNAVFDISSSGLKPEQMVSISPVY